MHDRCLPDAGLSEHNHPSPPLERGLKLPQLALPSQEHDLIVKANKKWRNWPMTPNRL
jgi:hypothetical protein